MPQRTFLLCEMLAGLALVLFLVLVGAKIRAHADGGSSRKRRLIVAGLALLMLLGLPAPHASAGEPAAEAQGGAEEDRVPTREEAILAVLESREDWQRIRAILRGIRSAIDRGSDSGELPEDGEKRTREDVRTLVRDGFLSLEEANFIRLEIFCSERNAGGEEDGRRYFRERAHLLRKLALNWNILEPVLDEILPIIELRLKAAGNRMESGGPSGESWSLPVGLEGRETIYVELLRARKRAALTGHQSWKEVRMAWSVFREAREGGATVGHYSHDDGLRLMANVFQNLNDLVDRDLIAEDAAAFLKSEFHKVAEGLVGRNTSCRSKTPNPLPTCYVPIPPPPPPPLKGGERPLDRGGEGAKPPGAPFASRDELIERLAGAGRLDPAVVRILRRSL